MAEKTTQNWTLEITPKIGNQEHGKEAFARKLSEDNSLVIERLEKGDIIRIWNKDNKLKAVSVIE